MENIISFESAKEEAPLLAAREIVKHLDGMEAFELLAIGYDDAVEMIAGIIRHFYGVPDGEPNPFTS